MTNETDATETTATVGGSLLEAVVMPHAPALDALLNSRCSYCGGPAEGNYSIHRDGFGEGPEVPLCDACGGERTPTLAEIWARIAEA
jgi:hypothetical protein